MVLNDDGPGNRTGSLPPSDSHGFAALLLVESLIHGLRETAVLTNAEAIDIVERAADVQQEHVDVEDVGETAMQRAHTLLSSIAASLKIDAVDTAPVIPARNRN